VSGTITDPYSGLQLVELSHLWGHGVPSLPGEADVKMHRAVKHSQHGVMAHHITTVLHTGTHMNAPLHLVQRGADMAGVSADRLFGNGAVVDVPKGRWELVTAADLQAAGPEIRCGDIVVVVTGWHHKYADGLEYFGEAPGLSKDAAEWLVEMEAKLVAVDTPQIDHPLATSLGPHRGGPLMRRLADEYRQATGLDPATEHPEWNVAHKTLLAAGIPTIEQVGGDVDLLKGRRATLAATPWKFAHGDACPVRMIAMVDPSGDCRLDPGT
jgi:kynurenine formamidase